MRTLAPPPFEVAARPLLPLGARVAAPVRAVGLAAPELKLRRRLGSALGTPDEAEAWLAFAAFAEGPGGDIGEAIVAYERALLFGDSAAIRRRLANLHGALGEPGLAAAEYAAAADVAEGREQVIALRQAALFYARDGAYPQAYAVLARARTRDPHDAVTLRLSAALHRIAPEVVSRTDARNALVDAASAESRAEVVEALLRTAAELDPHSVEVFAALHRLGDPRSLATRVGRARRAPLEARGAVLEVLAASALSSGDAALALALLLEARADTSADPATAGLLTRALGACNLHAVVEARDAAAAAISPALRTYASTLARWEIQAEALLPTRQVVDAAIAATSPRTVLVAMLAALQRRVHAGAVENRDFADVATLLQLDVSPAIGAYLADLWRKHDSLSAAAAAAFARLHPASLQIEEEVSLLESALAFAEPEERADLESDMAELLTNLPLRAARLRGLLSAQITAVSQPMPAAAHRALALSLVQAFVGSGAARAALPADIALALRVLDPMQAAFFAELIEPAVLTSGARFTYSSVTSSVLATSDAERNRSAQIAYGRALAVRVPTESDVALAMLAEHLHSPLRAEVLCALAARAESGGSAIAYARTARVLDPRCERAAVLLADQQGAGESPDAATFALALEAVGPVAAWLRALGAAALSEGRLVDAIHHARAWVDLVPGELDATDFYLRAAIDAADVSALGDALSWAVSQPSGQNLLAHRVASAVRNMANIRLEDGLRLAAIALDTFGLRQVDLRAVFLELAQRDADGHFTVRVVERWLASGAASGDQAELWCTLASARLRMGALSAAARALHRALVAQAPEARIVPLRAELTERRPQLDGDGVFALAQIDAELAYLRADWPAYASAMRESGVVLWDATGDYEESMRLWLLGARRFPAFGAVALGADLRRLLSVSDAHNWLARLGEAEDDPALGGALMAEAAHTALIDGKPDRAFACAAIALERNPARADALEVAERASVQIGQASSMEPLFRAVARSALGRFGKRAAHSRAARFFERQSDGARALLHAADSLLAVPAESRMVALLERVAKHADAADYAVDALEQIGRAAKQPGDAARWLSRAAALCSSHAAGRRRGLELRQAAVLAAPGVGLVAAYTDAVKAFLRESPDWHEQIVHEFSTLRESLIARLEGPDGARVMLALAEFRTRLEPGPGALVDVAKAIGMAGDLDEFQELASSAARYAQHDLQRIGLAACIDVLLLPHAHVGAEAVELLLALASAYEPLAPNEQFALLAVQARRRDVDALLRAYDMSGIASAWRARLREVVADERIGEALLARARELGSAESPHPHWLREALPWLSERKRASMMPLLAAAVAADSLASSAERDVAADGVSPALPTDALAALTTTRPGLQPTLVSRVSRASIPPEHTASQLPAQFVVRQPSVRPSRHPSGPPSGPTAAALAEGAQRWAEAGEVGEALFLYRQAAELAPANAAYWRMIVELSEETFDDRGQSEALRVLARLVDDDEQPAILKQLAHILGRIGEHEAAAQLWQALGHRLPEDPEVRAALLAVATDAGDAERVLSELALRMSALELQGGDPAELRALRFRKAALLEQRLRRPDQAAIELEQIVREGGPSALRALRFLGDVQERSGALSAALSAFDRLRAAVGANVELDLRRAGLLAKIGRASEGIAIAEELRRTSGGRPDILRVLCTLYRANASNLELGAALELLAHSAEDDAETRAGWLVEAAQCGRAMGDLYGALGRAQRAAVLTPFWSPAQVEARSIEYRLRGPGTPAEARAMIAQLEAVAGEESTELAAQRAFLLTEATDALQGRGAGLRTLLAAWELHRAPVLALALAERHVARFRFAQAVPYFILALEGDLYDFRRRGSVALAGADAALRASDDAAYRQFLRIACEDVQNAAAAHRQLLDLAARDADAVAVADHLGQLLALLRPTEVEQLRTELDALLSKLEVPWPQAGAPGRSRDSILPRLVLREQADTHDAELAPATLPSTSAKLIPSAADIAALERDDATFQVGLPVSPTPAQGLPDGIAERAIAAFDELELVAEPNAQIPGTTTTRSASALAELERAALAGDASKADELAELAEQQVPRVPTDALRFRRMAAELAPGDLTRLRALVRAAAASERREYVHALCMLIDAATLRRGASTTAAPSLRSQREQPGLLALLGRHAHEPLGLALRLIWEHGGTAILRATRRGVAPPSLGERLLPSSSGTLAVSAVAAAHLLGLPNLPLFWSARSKELSFEVLLAPSTTVRLIGEPDEDPSATLFTLGEATAAIAFPQCALVLGDEPLARAVVDAALRAFGNVAATTAATDSASRDLVELLWQVIPGRIQRRLETLLRTGDAGSFELLRERMRQTARRVGYFLSGDFGLAARRVLDDFGEVDNVAEHNFVALCQLYPSLADLYRLALRPEFAESRCAGATSPTHESAAP